MSEGTSSDQPTGASPLARTPGGGEAAGPSQSGQGTTKIADPVVTKVDR